MVHQFSYLGFTITDNLCLDPEICRRIGHAATKCVNLRRVWRNKKLTFRIKVKVYSACVLSTRLYWRETWTLFSRQERRLNTFHMRNLRLDIKWQDQKTNKVLSRVKMSSLYTMLQQQRLGWLRPIHLHGRLKNPQGPAIWQTSHGLQNAGPPQPSL